MKVATTFLEIFDRMQIKTALLPPNAKIIQSHIPLPSFYRFLYSTVGKNFNWTIRLAWSDEKLFDHLSKQTLSLYVLYVEGTPAGY